MKADIGIIGLGIMGQNLVLNFRDKGYSVAIYDRNSVKIKETSSRSTSSNLIATYSLTELVESLQVPRKILLMINAGKPVDQVIKQLEPMLDPNDIIMDGGNSNFKDTRDRFEHLKQKNIEFIGMGISGGEEGARFGPSIMPGGSSKAWIQVKEMLIAVSAKTDDGDPCCTWIGSDGAGHFVKTVHNGIEYGDMELIAESYDILHQIFQFEASELAEIFSRWNEGDLKSFLIEITADIFRKHDDRHQSEPLVDYILDKAGQKGTGKWTVHSALDFGMPVTLISAAVFQRFLSAQKELRTHVSSKITRAVPSPKISLDFLIQDLEDALYLAKLISYSQGFELLKAASTHHGWNLDLGAIARIWRAGCIIRSQFLDEISTAYTDKELELLLLAPYFLQQVQDKEPALRRIVILATQSKLSTPGFSAALSYLDGLSSQRLPANLIQAQRDYFGAHGYQRIDANPDRSFHTKWMD